MDDLKLLRDFRAECEEEDPRARAAAWRALEARFEVEAQRPRRARRRGIFALAGALAAACAVAAIVLLGSSSTAPPAAAAVLRQTATVAADSGNQTEMPGPGQFLYSKTKVAELQGWLPGGSADKGLASKQRGAFNAVVPIESESWIDQHGSARSREALGTPRFFTAGERARWKQQGSPLPAPFDPTTQREEIARMKGDGIRVLAARRGVFDSEDPSPPGPGLGPDLGFPSLKGLPTHPEALRSTIERNRAPGLEPIPSSEKGHRDAEQTISGLVGILTNPNATPALRAAAFNALAELPGIKLGTGATDLVGRKGDAITTDDRKYGTRTEYIFDPATSQVLDIRTTLVEPSRMAPDKMVPAGTVLRETAYLRSAVVDSTQRRH